MSDQRYILTIATGRKLYLELAINLARSFFWWHPDTDIIFRLVTDNKDNLPDDIRSKVEMVNIKTGELGDGFSSKLYLDTLASEGQTLFIDSDCLIFGKLDGLFEQFKGHSVSVVGGYIAKGEWFGDISSVCKKFSIPHLPKFNGGIYYLEKGEQAAAVYETARKLEKQYDEIGFLRLRNKPNDELLMALAMQLHHQKPLPDDGSVMSDPQACPGGYEIDVVTGTRWLLNPPLPSALHQNWYPFTRVSPLVVHFLGYYTLHYPYRREVYRLEKAMSGKLNTFTELVSLFIIDYPERVVQFIKNTFRPVYHKFAGPRKVKLSDRI